MTDPHQLEEQAYVAYASMLGVAQIVTVAGPSDDDLNASYAEQALDQTAEQAEDDLFAAYAPLLGLTA